MGSTPPSSHFILGRLGFGWSSDDARILEEAGYEAWLREQLQPGPDPRLQQIIKDTRLRIHYGASEHWQALDEMRPLDSLNKPIDQLWLLTDNKAPLAWQERQRPRQEVSAVTVLSAIYSRWQLREVMTDFWHNHFNVNAFDNPVSAALPQYDRDVIRRHCLGNFREFLEAVASSTAMLYYLNNRSSRTGIPNENYARELFELHTLGRDRYLNAKYLVWREVPGAVSGKPSGYIDEDVYEAARAFTGWGVEDGSSLGGDQTLPSTGRFRYVEAWHDNYQKRILGTEFHSFAGALQDGRRVLDLVATHPGTAQTLCSKLCRRLVSDAPSQPLIDSAAALWLKHQKSPQQIATVIQHIASSEEFLQSAGRKIKRPLEYTSSFIRASGLNFTISDNYLNELESSGQRLFGWTTPTGHPDIGDYWLSSHMLRRRWQLVAGLAEGRWNTGSIATPSSSTTGAFLGQAYWQMTGDTLTPDLSTALLQNLNLTSEQKLSADKNAAGSAAHLLAVAALSPAAQRR